MLRSPWNIKTRGDLGPSSCGSAIVKPVVMVTIIKCHVARSGRRIFVGVMFLYLRICKDCKHMHAWRLIPCLRIPFWSCWTQLRWSILDGAKTWTTFQIPTCAVHFARPDRHLESYMKKTYVYNCIYMYKSSKHCISYRDKKPSLCRDVLTTYHVGCNISVL